EFLPSFFFPPPPFLASPFNNPYVVCLMALFPSQLELSKTGQTPSPKMDIKKLKTRVPELEDFQ
ncbi:hypothetical protein L9F63_009175, partial [Diploptera punctata]